MDICQHASRKRRRLLDLSMRVTVYNSLTASSYWRVAAVLTEVRHDAVIGLPGTQKRVAVDAPRSMGSFMVISTWCFRVKQKCWCLVALLVSLVQTRTFATGMLPATPFERTMRCRGGTNRPRTLLFHSSLLASQAIWKG